LEQEAQQQHATLVSAENSLRLFTNRYVGGKDIYLQVITAQTVALANQLGDVDVLRRQLEARVLLVKALGGDWQASDLPKLKELTDKTPLY
jgi:outer membrane protein TolC